MKSPAAKYVNNDLISRVLIIVAMANVVIVRGDRDQCNDNLFESSLSTQYMQFTKETVSEEYAIEGEFKNLHCCAKGYRSIEW